MRIRQILTEGLSPFKNGTSIEFPAKKDRSLAEVQLLVGENGTGKTRILSMLAAAFGYPYELSTRGIGANMGFVYAEFPNVYAFWAQEAYWGDWAIMHGTDAKHLVPFLKEKIAEGRAHVTESLSEVPEVWGTPALAMSFRGVASLQNAGIVPLGTLNIGEKRDSLSFEHKRSDDSLIAQSLANLKIKSAIAAQIDQIHNRDFRMCRRIEDTIETITGRSFRATVETHPDVHLKVQWGEQRMRFEELPDGLRSIIGWLLGCIAKLDAFLPKDENPLDFPAIILLDEPETHLHPAWQRKLLPAVQRLLTNAQLIVATHSPFVISSVNSGWIHIFRCNDRGEVSVDPAKECSKGDSYMDVLEDILGIDEWYDPETEKLLADFRTLRAQVLKDPLSNRPEALEKLAKEISERSRSLQETMGREMRQFNVQLEARKATT